MITGLEDTLVSVNHWRAKFAEAKSVLIVGGGAVGTELAGEIKECVCKDIIRLAR